MGSDLERVISLRRSIEFQSTLPHGERPQILFNRFRFFASFNPRSHMGSDVCGGGVLIKAACFNPRSHMGSDLSGKVLRGELVVSIHAPTWGATVCLFRTPPPQTFQSTLPHGERLCCASAKMLRACFNPRSHMGSDRTLYINLFYNELQHYLCEINKYNN